MNDPWRIAFGLTASVLMAAVAALVMAVTTRLAGNTYGSSVLAGMGAFAFTFFGMVTTFDQLDVL